MSQEIQNELKKACEVDIESCMEGRRIEYGIVIDRKNTRIAEDGYNFSQNESAYKFSVSVPDVSILFDENPGLLKKIAATMKLDLPADVKEKFSFEIDKPVPALTFSFEVNKITGEVINKKLEPKIFVCSKKYTYEQASEIIDQPGRVGQLKSVFEALNNMEHYKPDSRYISANTMVDKMLVMAKEYLTQWAAENKIHIIADKNSGKKATAHLNKNLRGFQPFLNIANLGYFLRNNEYLIDDKAINAVHEKTDYITAKIGGAKEMREHFFGHGISNRVELVLKNDAILENLKADVKENIFYTSPVQDKKGTAAVDLLQVINCAREINKLGIKKPSDARFFGSLHKNLNNYFKLEPEKCTHFLENLHQILPESFKGFMLEKSTNYSAGTAKSRAGYRLLTNDDKVIQLSKEEVLLSRTGAKYEVAKELADMVLTNFGELDAIARESKSKSFEKPLHRGENSEHDIFKNINVRDLVSLSEGKDNSVVKVDGLIKNHGYKVSERYVLNGDDSVFYLKISESKESFIRVVIDTEKDFSAAREAAYTQVIVLIEKHAGRQGNWRENIANQGRGSSSLFL